MRLIETYRTIMLESMDKDRFLSILKSHPSKMAELDTSLEKLHVEVLTDANAIAK